MNLSDFKPAIRKSYWPAVVIFVMFFLGSWAVLAAIDKFTSMVDARVAQLYTPQNKEFERRLTEHDQQISQLIVLSRSQGENLAKVVTILEQRQREEDRTAKRR